MYSFKTKDDLLKFIASEVLTTSEAREYLGCSRQYLSQLIKEKKLMPIKSLSKDRLFFKDDVESIKNKRVLK